MPDLNSESVRGVVDSLTSIRSDPGPLVVALHDACEYRSFCMQHLSVQLSSPEVRRRTVRRGFGGWGPCELASAVDNAHVPCEGPGIRHRSVWCADNAAEQSNASQLPQALCSELPSIPDTEQCEYGANQSGCAQQTDMAFMSLAPHIALASLLAILPLAACLHVGRTKGKCCQRRSVRSQIAQVKRGDSGIRESQQTESRVGCTIAHEGDVSEDCGAMALGQEASIDVSPVSSHGFCYEGARAEDSHLRGCYEGARAEDMPPCEADAGIRQHSQRE